MHFLSSNQQVVKKSTKRSVAVWNQPHHYGNSHAIYGTTQCYLPPSRGDIPASTPTKASTRFSNPERMQCRADLVSWLHTKICYIQHSHAHMLQYFNTIKKTVYHLKMVTDPSTNWARSRVTLSIHPTMLLLRHTTNNSIKAMQCKPCSVICIGSCSCISFSTASSAFCCFRPGRRVFFTSSSPSCSCDRLWLVQWPEVRKFLLQTSQVNGFAPVQMQWCNFSLCASERVCSQNHLDGDQHQQQEEPTHPTAESRQDSYRDIDSYVTILPSLPT